MWKGRHNPLAVYSGALISIGHFLVLTERGVDLELNFFTKRHCLNQYPVTPVYRTQT